MSDEDFGTQLGLDGESADWPDSDDEQPGKIWDGTAAPEIEDFETVDAFQDAEQQWDIDQRVKRSLTSQGGGGGGTPLWGDDPAGMRREELSAQLEDYGRELAAAEYRGDEKTASDWKQRIAMSAKEVNQLPAPPEVTWKEDQWNGERGRAVQVLFDPEKATDPMFNNPELQRDAAILVSDFNKISKNKVALPLEDEAFGNPKVVKPENMVKFNLDEAQIRDFRASVYDGESLSPDEVFRKSWLWLREMGISGDGILAVDEKARKAAFESEGTVTINREKDPRKMTQKEYKKWRLEGGGN